MQSKDYEDAFHKNVEYFNIMYYRGLVNSPVDFGDYSDGDCFFDDAADSLYSTLYKTFYGFGRVITQYGE